MSLFFRRVLCASVLFAVAGGVRAELPAPIAAAIQKFHADGAKGWAYTETSSDGKRTLVERFNPVQPEFKRWTLLSENGRVPSAQEQYEYRARKYPPTGAKHPPPLKDQIEASTAELRGETATDWTYRFLLRPGARDDDSAAHMQIILRIDKATDTIGRFEISNFEPFSPVLSVAVDRMRTVMTYSLPANGEPSHLLTAVTEVSGRRMFFFAFREELNASYSDYARTPLARFDKAD